MFIVPAANLSTFANRSADEIRAEIDTWARWEFCRGQLSVPSADMRPADWRRLEGALRGSPIPMQIDGRFESGDDVESALAAGADFAVLGPRATEELDWLSGMAAQFPDQLLVRTRARDRRVRTRGAVRTLPIDLRNLAAELGDMPLAGLIIDFPPDDPVGFAELTLIEDVVEETSFPVMVGGGSPQLGTLRDLEFRGAAAAIIDAGYLTASFDETAIARTFVD